MPAVSVTVDPIKPLIGGLVHVEKARLCDAEVVEVIRRALEERGVLVFPRIGLSDEEQLALTEKLGGVTSYTRKVPGSDASAKDVYKVTLDRTINTEPEYVLGTFFWHIDGVTMDIPLPKATLLSARKLPASGGNTEFANLYAAYERLPDAEKGEIDKLRVIHQFEASLRPVWGRTPPEKIARYDSMTAPMEHPLVWVHEDGRRSLLIGTHADGIVGWPGAHGRALLTRLQQWAAQPDFTYSHEWHVGDLVIWDNEGLMHRVVPYTDEGRVMHRTSIAGRQRPGHVAAPEDVRRVLETTS